MTGFTRFVREARSQAKERRGWLSLSFIE